VSGIGILGGTFDPIHDGHLALGQAAYELLKLDHVLFVPAARPPHKVADRVTDPETRCRMVELAIAGNPAFEMSRMEIDRPGLSYTIDTLRAITAERREGGAAPDLTLILSVESLLGFNEWEDLAHQPLIEPGSPATSRGARIASSISMASISRTRAASCVRWRRAVDHCAIWFLMPLPTSFDAKGSTVVDLSWYWNALLKSKMCPLIQPRNRATASAVR
jgi:cytidyltransferase-like protein